jgi:hypothetical protein
MAREMKNHTEQHDPTDWDLPTSPEEEVECSLTLLASVLGNWEMSFL